ncbi:hypothetical protein ALP33_101358 [Pseudomonas amygdali pv. lachrymans]|uniref:Uncharacterized protein n=2 Tax=Pseudomonas amygdali TaxID=47877 RepID=A0A0Q0CAE8_PSEAJ|nr:hypothetical protein ALO35_101445 [Pseudomonas amygdali pv. lachrymans]KPY84711.1 hypothetical protein ALO60_101102 [Pseudomonas amygdali pv. tabaci]RML76689.1 hypothetical protein ALQ89_100251 [Pseudomonas amygdali pv. tabaci]RMM47075.1 hypothetical protein ALQ79_101306 [Pseudomonas amygdali pv. lachrymans]RMP31233.1 hypothetical protein ALQ26_101547 [Pseudomonas amygdali pv. lachrymans]
MRRLSAMFQPKPPILGLFTVVRIMLDAQQLAKTPCVQLVCVDSSRVLLRFCRHCGICLR